MRRKVVAGNWKMNCDFGQAEVLVEKILDLYPKKSSSKEIILAPPFPFLELSGDIAEERTDFSIAGQNCSEHESGAFTGEISAEMLQSCSCTYVILGHSERRQYFGESEELLFKKVQRVLDAEMSPIYCIGETLEQRRAGKVEEVLSEQLSKLFSLTKPEFENIMFAYEPVWAIGTGETASPEQAQETHQFIRAKIAEHMGEEVAEEAIILYGGSVKPSNAEDLFLQPDIDGGLIGGASLQAEDFVSIIQAF